MLMRHNASAQISLGELNKSINKLGKALTVVASGQKLNSAKDDSASFAISEVMREKIRTLEQDAEMQNGSAMLKTAEGGIQEQIEILKTIRQKVIDAANDSNGDEDRRFIRKELVQLYDQMEQIFESNCRFRCVDQNYFRDTISRPKRAMARSQRISTVQIFSSNAKSKPERLHDDNRNRNNN